MNRSSVFRSFLPALLGAALLVACAGPESIGRAASSEYPSEARADLPLRLPSAPSASALSARCRNLQAKAARFGRATDWRALAEAAVLDHADSVAADAYRREAAVYRRLGDVNAFRAEEAKADRYTVALRAFVREEATARDRARLDTGARLEPPLGCYVGAFIDRDDTLGPKYPDENWQVHMSTDRFEEAVGRPHASYFMYMSYGQSFPFKWCNELKRRGQIPHIAWEPSSLSIVRDDAYLRAFARDCGRFNAPIFLRFAGEMNGNWTSYHGNPAAYRRAFRTVAAAIHKAAPKAAMLWCPGARPVDTIASYYPGDDAVDWVGMNLYSVLYYDNDPRRPAADDPTDYVRPIYAMFAARKPIAVGEYAATHYAQVEGKERPAFAREKIARFYGAIPRLFPRLKLISWYDADNMRHARPGRQLNNYQLTDDRTIRRAYTDATRDPWYLGRAGDCAPVVYRDLKDGQAVAGAVPLSAWTKGPGDGLRVYWTVDGVVRFATAKPGPAAWTWHADRERPGAHRVSLLLYDARGRFLGGRGYAVTVRATGQRDA